MESLHCEGCSYGGHPIPHRGRINLLELKAVHLVLRQFMPYLEGKSACSLRPHLSCLPHKSSGRYIIHVAATGVKGPPDMGSSPPDEPTELGGIPSPLPETSSRRVAPPPRSSTHHIEAGVDLCASEASTHCLLWFSLAETTSPLGQDAFSHPWLRAFLYVFPPLSRCQPSPFWPGRTWFPLLHQLFHVMPWCLPIHLGLSPLHWLFSYVCN